MSYNGFIHHEVAHTHPVLLSFVALLMHKPEDQVTIITENDEAIKKIKSKSACYQRAKMRWAMIYTLINNSNIIKYRYRVNPKLKENDMIINNIN